MRDDLAPEAARNAVAFVLELEVIELRGEQPLASDGDSDSTGVDCDPAPTPLLRAIGSCTRPAGRIKDEIAGVRGHQQAAFSD
jgi:hypothetical protein